MPLIIHIGFHKTGTSAVQEDLYKNRQWLLENDINYPAPLCPFPSHGDLPWSLLGDDAPWKDREYKFEDVFEYYESILELEKTKTTVISSEDFSLLPHIGPKFHFFSKVMQKYAPKIAVYVRNPYDYVISAYHHAIRERHTNISFKEYLAYSFFDRAVDYESRISRWAEAFGSDAIILREYAAKGAIRDFYNMLGLPDPELLEENQAINVGVHPWLCDAYRKSPETESGEVFRGQLIELSRTLPKVNSLEFYLGEDWEEILRPRIGLDYSSLLTRYGRRSLKS